MMEFKFLMMPLSTTGNRIYIILNVLNQLMTVQADIAAYSYDNKRVDFEDLPLHLGKHIQLYNGLRGLLVVAWPENPCEYINSPPPTPPPPPQLRMRAGGTLTPLPFIILINGSDCNFYSKVLRAEEAGYHAAIIHNVDSKDFIQMDSKDVRKQINIPTLFVTEETAISLKEAYTYDKGAHVVLSIYSLFFTYLIIIVLTIMPVCVIFFPCLALLLMSSFALNKLMLKRLPVHTYKEGDAAYDTCAICLEDYVEGEKLRVLPCCHAYHKRCVDHWLPMKRTCPVCMRGVEVNSYCFV